VPGIGLQAHSAHAAPLPGDVACVSQSASVIGTLIDWATARGIGFSHLVSLGDMSDVDFGDMLDYLANRSETHSILLYVEAVTHARKFMSAARAAARNKPVIVIKAGRHAAAAKAATSHTGALAGADDVYDAAFRRAGMLRVRNLDELFAAVETLARLQPIRGDRLAILTNGGGLGVLATDDLLDAGGRLAELTPETRAALDKALPRTWSHGNPIDIIGDAPPERYATALSCLLEDRGTDAVLVLNCPTAIGAPIEAADAVIATLRDHPQSRNVLTSWLGDFAAVEARRRFAQAGVPSYATPGEAIAGFMDMARFRRNQELLLQVPAAEPQEFTPDRAAAEAVLGGAVAARREWLDETDARALLGAYGIPTVMTETAATIDAVASATERLGGVVAVKILSPDIVHKSDVGGVALNLVGPDAAAKAAAEMLARIKRAQPDARIDGFTVQQMIRRPGAFELIAGLMVDPTFGPVVLFGQGGVGVEVIKDKALALPPLNTMLAHDLIERTRVAAQLRGYRNRPPADIEAIARTLIRLAQLIADQPAVAELDINPLLADEHGVIALDARVRVRDPASAVPMAVLCYPNRLEHRIALRDGTELFVRPIRPEDAHAITELFAHLTPQDVRSRFFVAMKALPPSLLARLTQIDYDREMALVAMVPGTTDLLGVARLSADPDNVRAEYAIVVRSDWKGHGLGYVLMQEIVDYARARGIGEVFGTILNENAAMIDMARELGFTIGADPDDASLVTARLTLGAADAAA
ncbi:MAG TPA: bifunctional acetate--CoA ligase family protein/GNAT family N-acetyltransferase, partial [Candidatus Sulfotelmatobacter sp.]|nr:bifunctional acetate--CoA ligase family protein/GNAT family N-acetyltransferase [Candidatus Sulfotelmatobacter sp.]